MFKHMTIIGFLLVSLIGYSQKSTLIQNINVRAKELKHRLNDTGDSLILEGQRKIYTVEIFNSEFERKIHVKKNTAIISLKEIPVGKFIVEATLVDKLIVMTLFRNEPLVDITKNSQARKKLTLVNDYEIKEMSNNVHSKEKETITTSKIVSVSKDAGKRSSDELNDSAKKHVLLDRV